MVYLGELGRGRVLSGQQPGCQRPVREEAESPLAAERQLPLLDVAVEQAVGPLVRDDRRDLQGAGELQVRRVAHPDRQRLPFHLQLVEPFELPLPPLERLMQLQQIHIVARQTAERGFERSARIVVGADLGGDRDPLAVGPERPAEQGFRRSVAVGRRRVEERDPALDGALDRAAAGDLVVRRSPSFASYRPAAEPEARLGRYETRKGPDVSPGPRAHLIRTLRSGRSAAARSSQ